MKHTVSELSKMAAQNLGRPRVCVRVCVCVCVSVSKMVTQSLGSGRGVCVVGVVSGVCVCVRCIQCVCYCFVGESVYDLHSHPSNPLQTSTPTSPCKTGLPCSMRSSGSWG